MAEGSGAKPLLIDIAGTPAALGATAETMLERARWASEAFLRYDRSRVLAIAEAVAEAAHEKAEAYAEWAVRETGFGVVAHKKLKNELTARPFLAHYRDWDFVNPRTDPATGVVEVPRPAGVIFALVPSTNPIATVNFKSLCALLTRNAIVLSPHPAARECCVDAARMLARVAEAAGAPDGVIQVVERPNIPLIEEFMRSDGTDVILATGGNAMVRSAYSSSNPALGVGPGNAPCYVDESADLAKAAQCIAESKSFDNSVLCTNESVLVAHEAIVEGLKRELAKAGCHLLSEAETATLRGYLFHARGFNVEALGRDAQFVADAAGLKIPRGTCVLVAPINAIGIEEPLSREKLCPVIALFTATSRSQAIAMSRAVLRFQGAGHSAAIHARDAQTILDYAAAVESYRVVVNAPCSQGAAGFGTNLAPTFTVGTGFFGRSSIGENLGPQHLVHWTRVAFGAGSRDLAAGVGSAGMRLPGPLPEPAEGGLAGFASAVPARGRDPSQDQLREEIRRVIAEELRLALKGGG